MQTLEITWTETEKKVAQEACEKAHTREIEALIGLVREQVTQIQAIEDMWKLHDFLSARRHDIDGKYDDRPPFLIFTFAKLVKEGWLELEELQGLAPEKLTKIAVLTRM